MAASVNNYTIGNGVASISADGMSWTDLGNCSKFEFTPNIEKLDHFSSRSGVKTKDLTVVLSKSGTLSLTLDEITVENLMLAVFGAAGTSGVDIEILAADTIVKHVKIVGDNDVGNSYTWTFPSVSFIPGQAFNVISEEWQTIDLEGEVAKSGGSFGTIVAP